mmetsp:Transcript_19087/g.51301  ORF Transcript_19087/g.51301 Transcript_19087/m.51301 type:complete len:230 (+) Transcript_19087:341-1030(+)
MLPEVHGRCAGTVHASRTGLEALEECEELQATAHPGALSRGPSPADCPGSRTTAQHAVHGSPRLAHAAKHDALALVVNALGPKIVPHALVEDKEHHLILEQVDRGLAAARRHHHGDDNLLELIRELAVQGRLPHEPPLAVREASHELAVLAPRPAPHAAPTKGPVGEMSQAWHDGEHVVRVRDVPPLVVIDQALVPGQAGVHVHPEGLALLQALGLVQLELHEVVGGGV